MGIMLNLGKELLRISSKDSKILESSINNGLTWTRKTSANNYTGTFKDLNSNGKEILGTTDKGLFSSPNNGLTWTRKN